MGQRSQSLAALKSFTAGQTIQSHRSAIIVDFAERRRERLRPPRHRPKIYLEHWLIGAVLCASYILAAIAFF